MLHAESRRSSNSSREEQHKQSPGGARVRQEEGWARQQCSAMSLVRQQSERKAHGSIFDK